jgi:hypothetical protein
MSQVAARMAAAKAFRCFYVAETYGSVGKWKEAQARLVTSKLRHASPRRASPYLAPPSPRSTRRRCTSAPSI